MLNLEDEDNLEFDISDFKDIDEILNDYEDDKPQKKESKYKLITRRIDTNRIRHKTAKNLEVYTSLVKNVKMEMENPTRCGAIIYTNYNGKTYFCLGIDSAYGDLTDFGGGVKKNESVIEGGLRELEEESQGIFGKMSPEEIKNCMAFYSSNMMVIFIKKEVNIEEITNLFNKKISNELHEVKGITWLEKEDFLNSIAGKGKRIYSRVRKILYKVSDIISAM